MTTIIQKMWRDGVPGPDGGLVMLAESSAEMPVYKCSSCDGITITRKLAEQDDPVYCSNCSFPIMQTDRL